MAKLARKINKAAFDKLSKDLQASYTVNDDDDDEYILDLDESDDDNPDALRRARDREKKRAKDAAAELAAAKLKLKELEDGGNDESEEIDEPSPRNKRRNAKRDVATIDAAWKEKYAALEAERDEKISAKDQVIRKTLINNAANSLAAKISTAPSLMMKAIAERLDVDFEDDEPRLVVLDGDGRPSTLTLDKLEKEFKSNKEFASVIIGTKASGGGAPRNGPDQKPVRGGASGEEPDLSKMPAKELAARLKEQRETS